MPFLDDSILDSIAGHARSAHKGLAGFTESVVRRATDVLEVGGAAAAFSYAGARWGTQGEYKLAGLPIDIWGAIAGLGAAWFNLGGRYDRDAEMIGAGALASYLARMGAQYGAHAAAGTQTAGRPELVGRVPAALAANAAAHQAGQRYAVRAVP